MGSIESIIHRKSILEYLEKRGHYPVKVSGGRHQYFCPLPDHEDRKTPSFMVWKDGFEKFYCFGCMRYLTIIHLVAYMEGLTFREAAKRLADDLEISLEEDFEFTLSAFERDCKSGEMFRFITDAAELGEVLLSMSSMVYTYLESVKFNRAECGIMDQFWSIVDDEIDSFDYSAIKETHKYLPTVLNSRLYKVQGKVQE